jgi:hypothetical protein
VGAGVGDAAGDGTDDGEVAGVGEATGSTLGWQPSNRVSIPSDRATGQ